MQTLFGIPIGALSVGLVVALAAVVAVVVAIALRNRIFLRLGLRNVSRGRGRTVLIVLGLMLGTAIISSALGTGDTIAQSMRSSVIESYGQTDELVAVKGSNTSKTPLLGQATGSRYFDSSVLETVRKRLPRSAPIDGLAPAIVEPMAAQNAARRQNEPRVTLFASDPARLHGFDTIAGSNGEAVSLAALRPGEVYVNRGAADALEARRGDRLTILVGTTVATVTVRDVVSFRGSGTDKSAVLMPLDAAQQLLGRPGQVKYLLVSNSGGVVLGASRSDEVARALRPVLRPLGLESQLVKKDGLDNADAQGRSFMSMFTTFGTFSIVAGILLIFLIFVMLSAERRAEMGISRAVGTQRGHLVETFVFEGLAYDVVAAAVGALLGVAIAYGMVLVMARALQGTAGITIQHELRLRSILLAYALGVLVTFAVVALSAWRVSNLNIVAAIRNLPDPSARRTHTRRWVWPVVAMVAGLLLTFAGFSASEATPLMLGVSVILVSLIAIARLFGVRDRLAFTAGGLALVVFWLLPFAVLDSLTGGLKMNFSVWIIGGLVAVLGTTWTVMYNADILLNGTMRVFGRIRSMAPVLRIAIAYPLRSRFRTGVTLAMFTLVVFTLVVGATTSGAFIDSMDNTKAFGGGFDVRAEVSPFTPVGDMRTAVRSARGVDRGAIKVVAAQSFVPVDARQASVSSSFEPYALRGLDDAFLDHNTYQLAAVARGYSSPGQVWRALKRQPGLAVVDASVVPHRRDWNLGVRPDFRLGGFVAEDKSFSPVPIETKDPQTGRILKLRVIGVLRDDAPLTMAGISTSQQTLSPFGARAQPTVYSFGLAPGTDAHRMARHLESAFLANGMEARATSAILADAVGSAWTFNRLIQGFLGLGLIVGVAALAVISARSVVERRQQIGVLRAIGFQRAMVQLSFLLEASFISLVAIGLGTLLGLLMSYNVIADARNQPNSSGVAFGVPWLNLLVVFAVVYAAALAATSLPARKASRVYAAEALRYQ